MRTDKRALVIFAGLMVILLLLACGRRRQGGGDSVTETGTAPAAVTEDTASAALPGTAGAELAEAEAEYAPTVQEPITDENYEDVLNKLEAEIAADN